MDQDQTLRDQLIDYFSTLKSPDPGREPDEVAAGWADDVLRIVAPLLKADQDEIYIAWREAARERHEAEVAQILLDRIRRLAQQKQHLVDGSWMVRADAIRDALEEAETPADIGAKFDLTPAETVTVQDWFYCAGDDFIPDDADRDLVRRLGNFAHVHGATT